MEHISAKFTDKYNRKDDGYFTLPMSWLSEERNNSTLEKPCGNKDRFWQFSRVIHLPLNTAQLR